MYFMKFFPRIDGLQKIHRCLEIVKENPPMACTFLERGSVAFVKSLKALITQKG